MHITTLPEELANNPEIVAEHRRMAIAEISRTISMSEIRCLPFDGLLKRIERLWEDPQAGEIVYRVCEEQLSDIQLYALAECVRQLADAVDLLPSARIDVFMRENPRFDMVEVHHVNGNAHT